MTMGLPHGGPTAVAHGPLLTGRDPPAARRRDHRVGGRPGCDPPPAKGTAPAMSDASASLDKTLHKTARTTPPAEISKDKTFHKTLRTTSQVRDQRRRRRLGVSYPALVSGGVSVFTSWAGAVLVLQHLARDPTPWTSCALKCRCGRAPRSGRRDPRRDSPRGRKLCSPAGSPMGGGSAQPPLC